MADRSNRRITVQTPSVEKAGRAAKSAADDASEAKPKKETGKRAPRKKKADAAAAVSPAAATTTVATPVATATDELVGTPCPLCGKGTVIKGKTAYGCSEWRNGCSFRKPF